MSPFAEAALIITSLGAVIGTTAAESMDRAPTATGILLWAAGVATAIGVLWRFLHVGELLTGTRNFLKDYNGEPARPGVEQRPGLPERLGKIEAHTHELKGAFPAMVVALDELQRSLAENGNRITEHRRRNEDQALLLRMELEQRAKTLEDKLAERNAAVDARLEHLSDDLLRAETYRASLVELGFDPERRETARDRRDDT